MKNTAMIKSIATAIYKNIQFYIITNATEFYIEYMD